MAQRDLAPAVVQALLMQFIAGQKPPPGSMLYGSGESTTAMYLVRTAASAATAVFWLPYAAYTYLRKNDNGDAAAAQQLQDRSKSPLADVSVCLLLALRFYAPPPSPPPTASGRLKDAPRASAVSSHLANASANNNPYRAAMGHLQDADDLLGDEAMEGGHGGGAVHAAVPYAALFDALGRTLMSREPTIVLLYSLLQETPHFNQYCMARSDLDFLVLPILELLYMARGRSANQLYMMLIVLLILSQDTSFAHNVHKVPLGAVPFYKERKLSNTTLGSLLVVLLLRTAQYNLVALKVHADCCLYCVNCV